VTGGAAVPLPKHPHVNPMSSCTENGLADVRENTFRVNGDYPFLPKIFCRFFLSDKKQYAGFFGTTGSVRVSIGLENPKKEMTGFPLKRVRP